MIFGVAEQEYDILFVTWGSFEPFYHDYPNITKILPTSLELMKISEILGFTVPNQEYKSTFSGCIFIFVILQVFIRVVRQNKYHIHEQKA